MSVRVMSWVFDHAPTTDPTDQLVLLAIADRCDDDGHGAYPSNATIARKTRLSVRTVIRSKQRLEAAGLLVNAPGQGRRGTNLYTVTLRCQPVTPDTASPLTESHPTTDGESLPPCQGVTATPDTASPDPSFTSCTSGTPAPPVALPFTRPSRKSRVGLLRPADPTCYRDAPGPLGVPHRLHAEFLELRTVRGMSQADAVRELDAFYERWIVAYTEGDRRDRNAEADRFKFWRARHAETWPPQAAAGGGSRDTSSTASPYVPNAEATRRMLDEVFSA